MFGKKVNKYWCALVLNMMLGAPIAMRAADSATVFHHTSWIDRAISISSQIIPCILSAFVMAKLKGIAGKNNPYKFVKSDKTLDDYAGGYPEELDTFVDWVDNRNSYEGINSPKGAILYGPTGTGKTYLAKCLAGTLDIPLITVKAPELKGSLRGEDTANIKKLFNSARQAAMKDSSKTCMIILDEADSVLIKRKDGNQAWSSADKDMVNALLAELDGVENHNGISVMLIACTNAKMESLDDALIRSGRLSLQVKIPPLTLQRTRENLEFQLQKIKDFGEERTKSEVEQLSKVARGLYKTYALHSSNKCITPSDINELVGNVHKSIIKGPGKNNSLVTYQHILDRISGELLAKFKITKVPYELSRPSEWFVKKIASSPNSPPNATFVSSLMMPDLKNVFQINNFRNDFGPVDESM